MTDDASDPRTLLARLAAADPTAPDELAPLLYAELHRIAERLMRGERRDHTLQPTALVHEAWARLAGSESAPANDDSRHFLRLAARVMRQVLVDHARARRTAKRDAARVTGRIEHWALAFEEHAIDVIALHDAIVRLEAIDAWLAEVVELRFFAGLSIGEVAAALDCSVTTVERGWRTARAWLRRELAPE